MGLRPKLARQMMAGNTDSARFQSVGPNRQNGLMSCELTRQDFVSCRVSCFFCYCALIKITKGLREIKPTFTATIAACSEL
jgi:hypothetical protein